MKKAILSAAVLAAALVFALDARAESRTHAAAKISVEVPAGWTVEAEEDSMTIADPKEEAAVFMHILEAKDLQKALEAIDSEIGSAFKDVKWEGEAKNDKLNGMDAVSLDGSAKMDGKPVEVGVMLLATPAHKILLVLGAVEKSKSSKHEKALVGLIASLKPAK